MRVPVDEALNVDLRRRALAAKAAASAVLAAAKDRPLTPAERYAIEEHLDDAFRFAMLADRVGMAGDGLERRSHERNHR